MLPPWHLQADLVQYLHAGMIQHDPQGRPAFLHRTAEAKMYPFNTGYRKVEAPPTPCRFLSGLKECTPGACSVHHARGRAGMCYVKALQRMPG